MRAERVNMLLLMSVHVVCIGKTLVYVSLMCNMQLNMQITMKFCKKSFVNV